MLSWPFCTEKNGRDKGKDGRFCSGRCCLPTEKQPVTLRGMPCVAAGLFDLCLTLALLISAFTRRHRLSELPEKASAHELPSCGGQRFNSCSFFFCQPTSASELNLIHLFHNLGDKEIKSVAHLCLPPCDDASFTRKWRRMRLCCCCSIMCRNVLVDCGMPFRSQLPSHSLMPEKYSFTGS